MDNSLKKARFLLQVHTRCLLTQRFPLKLMNMTQHHQYLTQQDKRQQKRRAKKKEL